MFLRTAASSVVSSFRVVGRQHRLQSSNAAKPLKIMITSPDNTYPATQTWKSLEHFQGYYSGWKIVNTKTDAAIFVAKLIMKDIDPSIVYDMQHPFFTSRRHEAQHSQISDKAFEEKSINALECYLFAHLNLTIQRRVAQNPDRVNGWRFLTRETDVAEWEGIWEGPDGHVYFLEAKHFMDNGKLEEILKKLNRSLEFLKIDHAMATVYVAGKYWDGQALMELAGRLGVGIIWENGLGLEIKEPSLKLQSAMEGVGGEEALVSGKKKASRKRKQME